MTLEGCPRIAVLMIDFVEDDIGRMSEDSSSDDDLWRTRILFFFQGKPCVGFGKLYDVVNAHEFLVFLLLVLCNGYRLLLLYMNA
jgi:hypothetical protein